MRALALLLLVLPLAPEAQVRYAVNAPDTIPLGAPLVLEVTATLTEPAAYPVLAFPGIQQEEATTVRRASGEIVTLSPILTICGIGVPMVLTGAQYPAGTVAHRRLVLHDARLMEPGRYVVEVEITTGPTSTERVTHAIGVVTPDTPDDRAAAEATAYAVRATTDRRFWEGLERSNLDVMLAALDVAADAPGAEALRVHAALEAASQSVQWSLSGRSDADSVSDGHAATALRLADRSLARRPSGAYAPEAARARMLALSRHDAADVIPVAVGLCEGRRFHVRLAQPGPHRLLGIGTGESITVSASGEVVFTTAPEAAHLMRGDEIVAVALPERSSCRQDLWPGVSPAE